MVLPSMSGSIFSIYVPQILLDREWIPPTHGPRRVELLSTITLSGVFQMVLNATAQPLNQWVSWDDTHYNFSRVRVIPAVSWNMDRWSAVGIQNIQPQFRTFLRVYLL